MMFSLNRNVNSNKILNYNQSKISHRNGQNNRNNNRQCLHSKQIAYIIISILNKYIIFEKREQKCAGHPRNGLQTRDLKSPIILHPEHHQCPCS